MAWGILLPETPETSPSSPPAFAPGEREYLHQTVRETISNNMAQGRRSPPTDPEYKATCDGLETYQWEATGRFHMDSDHTERMRTIASALKVVFEAVEQTVRDHGYAEYHIADFCEDVRGT